MSCCFSPSNTRLCFSTYFLRFVIVCFIYKSSKKTLVSLFIHFFSPPPENLSLAIYLSQTFYLDTRFLILVIVPVSSFSVSIVLP
uniref:Ovule protein n=1 Tax=Panagrolaimus sp. ES5 TaxID=591445 RepID=A0AC34FDS6_9BILA